MDRNTRYFNELGLRLMSAGYSTRLTEHERLGVEQAGEAICEVGRDGTVYFKNRDDPGVADEIDRVIHQASVVAEYVAAFDSSPKLNVAELEERYRQLADFGGVCLAARSSVHGMQFVTWRWDKDHGGVSLGHYFGNEYEGAKQDFAVRSGLINENRLFSQEQLGEMYRCCGDAQRNDPFMDDEAYRRLDEIQEKIRAAEPELVLRLDEDIAGMQMNDVH